MYAIKSEHKQPLRRTPARTLAVSAESSKSVLLKGVKVCSLPSPPVTQVGGGGGPRCAARVEGSWGDALVAVAVESTTAMLVWWSVEDGHVTFFCVWQRRKPIYSCDRVKKSG
jgi:hypothetical protein